MVQKRLGAVQSTGGAVGVGTLALIEPTAKNCRTYSIQQSE